MRLTRRGRLLLTSLVLTTVSVGGGAALAHLGDDGGGRPAARAPAEQAPPASGPARERAPRPEPAPGSTAKPKPEATRKPAAVPRSGPGTFTTATASGGITGTGGTLRRYRVEIEQGIDLPARGTAAEIEAILAHPRGWAAHGRGRFRQVASGADFVIRIATPDTADALCAREGLDTGGELNCETAEGVVVNLRRWVLGSPAFAGPPEEYRHLIVNHEVGHELGLRRHLGCGGPGKAAPVMMQQIKGLDGCRSNAFPYSEEGIYITGPIVS
ncbi:DUF3152 domain-containing protein [Streptomyces griseus]|uniref:DUF3152 domain-containing protein n=1 Tax=Streptomyces griseus TaxID=1911 RepID=UPI00068FEF5B|nr:DUF3152 domain-containing protein [Streptomyces griseus]